MSLDLSLESFRAAADRLRGSIVETPMVRLHPSLIPEGSGVDSYGVALTPTRDDRIDRPLSLKLECLQVTGSFKARGALNRLLTLDENRRRRGIITASGGNHGLAVAYAGRRLGVPTVVYLPTSTTADKALRIERWGATVIRAGSVWDEAHVAALEHAEREGLTYLHSFADAEVVHGQGTIALEIFERAPDVDALIVAIGGGGLLSGMAAVTRLLRQRGVRIIGVEPTGAPTLFESLRAGRVVELPAITTRASTLAPRKSDDFTFDIIRASVDDIVLVTDDEMHEAACFLHETIGVGVELSGAAAVAAVLSQKAMLARCRHPCALVCGMGTESLAQR